MKAGVVFGKDDIRYTEWEDPAAGDSDVVVDVKACGICGSDVPRVLGDEAHFYPIILGHEFAGEVSYVGKDVTRVAVGDHVVGIPLIPCMECEECKKGNYALCPNYSFVGSRRNGAFADKVALPETNVLKVDRNIPFDVAALFEPSTVSLHGLCVADFKEGSSVAVLGIGAIGVFAVQWARILGASRIVAIDVADERLQLSKEIGATEVYNTAKTEDIPKGFDYVFETAGQPDTIKLGYEMIGSNGTLCCIGTPHKDFDFPWKTWENINRKEATVKGTWMSYSAPFPGKEWGMTADRFADGSLIFTEDIIYSRMPMSQIREAFDMYKVPGQVKGRIILENE